MAFCPVDPLFLDCLEVQLCLKLALSCLRKLLEQVLEDDWLFCVDCSSDDVSLEVILASKVEHSESVESAALLDEELYIG